MAVAPLQHLLGFSYIEGGELLVNQEALFIPEGAIEGLTVGLSKSNLLFR